MSAERNFRKRLAQGDALYGGTRFPEALRHAQAMLADHGRRAEALFQLGRAFHSLGRFAEAVEALSEADRLYGGERNCLNYLGSALIGLGDLKAAIGAYRRAVGFERTQPGQTDWDRECRYSLAWSILFSGGVAADAIDCLKPVVAEMKEGDHFSFESALLMVLALGTAGAHQTARELMTFLLTRHPDHPKVQFEHAVLRLRAGDFQAGFAAYEARLALPAGTTPPTDANLWRGEPLDGRQIVVHAEQGLGDWLMMCRLVPRLADLGARVFLQPPSSLRRLTATLDPRLTVMDAARDELSADALRAPLMSLPRRLDLRLADLPVQAPYLMADPAATDAWRARLDAGRLSVGVCWAVATKEVSAGLRSVGAASFARLPVEPWVEYVSLYPEPVKGGRLPPDFGLRDWTAEFGDFADTAALVMALDLVITCDTAVAHLAGSLGKPVWVLVAVLPDWRWMSERQDNPWYPTARVYRQTVPGNWDAPIAAVAADLRKLAGKTR